MNRTAQTGPPDRGHFNPGLDEDYGTNVGVLARVGIVLENLTNLHELPPAALPP